MKKSAVLVAMALFIVFPALAQDKSSNNKMYIGGHVGLSILNDEEGPSGVHQRIPFKSTMSFSPGFNLAGVVGYRVTDNIRVEGEVSYSQNEVNSATGKTVRYGSFTFDAAGTVGIFNVMANGYYDFNNQSPVTPYIGAGIGMARISVSNIAIRGVPIEDVSYTTIAYQGIVGIGYKITPQITLDLDYRLGEVVADLDKTGATQHTVNIGVRYGF